MHDTKERLSVLWIFVLLNYLYADVLPCGTLLAWDTHSSSSRGF